ncbi:hypothetical protein HNE_2359 [Hyphomonas neptunium ATCC 15444]|uniref:PepSY domain-containing protein n=2 Tax=Hyphomonas TaxID=85 RepID=Q0BZN9_HYPNA|nr:hypothetical protein HNE_2359 [Hyphomonas neptunium ATCC 15444]
MRKDETMKTTPYVIGAIVVGMFAAGSLGAGTSSAQGEALKGAGAEPGPIATPAKYAISEHASFDEVTRRLAEQGFEVMDYELDDRRIEVTGLTATGHCMELKFNAVSGKELRRKRDDDCRPGDDG